MVQPDRGAGCPHAVLMNHAANLLKLCDFHVWVACVVY